MKAVYLTLGLVACFLIPLHSETYTFDVDADQIHPAIVRGDGTVEINWSDWLDGRQGRLERAESVNGPWQSVGRSTPHQSDSSQTAQQFYRVRARPVTMHIPENYDPQTPMPVVLLLHPYIGGSERISDNRPAGQFSEGGMKFLPLSESHGFLYAFPDGLLDVANWQFWAANEDCCDFRGIGVDDHVFLKSVIDSIRSEYNVDSKRIYLIGHSNGALLACEFATRHPELIAAVVALAPPVSVNALKTVPAQPVRILHIQGTSDTLVPYEGGPNTVNFPIGPLELNFLGAQRVIEIWAQFNGCSNLVSDSERTLDLVGEIAGADTTVSRYETCPSAGAVELWTIQGGDHFFRNPTTEFRERVIEWLLQHPKP